MRITEIRAEQLESINEQGTILIQFYKNDCEECEKIKQEIEKIPEEGLYFYALRVNIDENIDFIGSYNIESPTLLVIKGDKILGREESFMNAQEISEWAHFSTIMGW